MEMLKLILRTLILPPAAPLLVALVGLLSLRRRRRLGRGLITLGLVSLWLLSLQIIAGPLERLAEHDPALTPTRLAAAHAEAIVILGGGGQRRYAPEYDGPAAKPYLLERLAYGAWLARRTGLPVLVTGFKIEAVAMQDTLARNFGIHTRWVDGSAFDTFENAHNAARLLHAAGVERVLLVSSAAQERRAAHEFTAAGLQVVPAPVGISPPAVPDVVDFLPSAEALLTSNGALHELIGEPVRVLLAWMDLRRQ